MLKNLNRLCGRTTLVLSLIALLAVLSGYTQPRHPAPTDEGAAAHIFQIAIVLFVATLLLFLRPPIGSAPATLHEDSQCPQQLWSPHLPRCIFWSTSISGKQVMNPVHLKPTTRTSSKAQPASPASRSASHPSESLKLDAVIHERVRLGIISALAVNDELSFNDLKRLLEITDGNLSVHARKLEVAGYVKCTKSFVGRQPRTEYRITSSGRCALEGYLKQMESVIRSARRD